MASADSDVVIGIDLGTTFSCVGAWIDGKVKILTDNEGRRTLPSYVSFTEHGKVFGWEAKALAVENPKNTVFDVKRLIGRKYSEPSVQKDLEQFGFDVVRLDKDDIGISVELEGNVQIYRPEEISGMVLKHIKELAEKQVGRVSRAVITVPAYFNDGQRSATKRAGKEAGLQVLRILNEPTAAAVAYGLNKREEKNILIFDLGGGTFDVSLLTIDDGIFEVKSTSGDTHLGGEDFDTLLADHCIAEFTKKFKVDAEDVRNDCIAMRALRTECEICKCSLSSSNVAVLEIGNFFNGEDLRVEITRAEFNCILQDLYSKMKEPVECVLRENNGMSKSEVNEVVLVGGSTRIPGVQSLLRDYFGGKELCNSIDPDEAVASGAAIQAAIIVEADPIFKEILLVDVLPLSLGIAVGGKQMDVLMPKNSPIPRSAKEIYTTFYDNQELVRIEIYEGERVRVKDNHFLGAFELEVENALAGVPQVEVTFVINADGILQVTGQNVNTGARRQITVRNQNHTDEDILEAYEEEEMYKEDDEQALLAFEAKEGLREYTISIKNRKDNIVSNDMKRAATKVLDWLEQNENCPHDLYETKQNELETLVGKS